MFTAHYILSYFGYYKKGNGKVILLQVQCGAECG